MQVWHWLRCHILRDHDWTSRAKEGILPDRVEMRLDPVGYFEVYSEMYCKRCRKISRIGEV